MCQWRGTRVLPGLAGWGGCTTIIRRVTHLVPRAECRDQSCHQGTADTSALWETQGSTGPVLSKYLTSSIFHCSEKLLAPEMISRLSVWFLFISREQKVNLYDKPTQSLKSYLSRDSEEWKFELYYYAEVEKVTHHPSLCSEREARDTPNYWAPTTHVNI